MKKLLIVTIMLCFAGNAFASMGIRYNPLDGAWYAPSGTLFAIMYAKQYSSSESYEDGEKSTDTHVSSNIGVVRLGFFQDIGKIRTQGSVILPFGAANVDRKIDMSAAGVPVPLNAHYSSTGLADAEINYIIRAAVWGEGTANDGYIALGASVFAPIGEYSTSSPVNLGKNRWAFRPLAGVGQNFGAVHIDLFVGADFFMDNNNYTVDAALLNPQNEHFTLKQNPEMWSEVHATLFLSAENRTYISASFGGVWAGAQKAEKDGVRIDVSGGKETYTARMTIGTTLTRHYSLYAYYAQDLSATNGNKGNEFGIRLGLIQLPR
jgi:hypothetical protein